MDIVIFALSYITALLFAIFVFISTEKIVFGLLGILSGIITTFLFPDYVLLVLPLFVIYILGVFADVR